MPLRAGRVVPTDNIAVIPAVYYMLTTVYSWSRHASSPWRHTQYHFLQGRKQGQASLANDSHSVQSLSFCCPDSSCGSSPWTVVWQRAQQAQVGRGEWAGTERARTPELSKRRGPRRKRNRQCWECRLSPYPRHWTVVCKVLEVLQGTAGIK